MRNRTLFIALFALVSAPVLAGCAQNADQEGETNLNLNMGVLMPLTGELSGLGGDMQGGADLAIKQINAADAGIKITAFHEDDRTSDTAQIVNTFNRLAQQGVTAIAGPCCSGITDAILPPAITEQIVIASPSATSPTLTERDNQGYFWRVSPTDEGQGKVLARLVHEDGHKRVNMIIVNNAYGNGMADVFRETATSLDATMVVGTVSKFAESGATSYSSQVTEACATDPEAIVLVAYTDSAAGILREMQTQGCLDGTAVYSAEGAFDDTLPTKAGQDANGNWLAAGIKGTKPGGNLSKYNALFRAEYQHDPQTYSAESYDAVMYLTLAALSAKSTDGADIAEHLLRIANPPGTKFTADQFAQAAEALENGDDIDYVGYAHDLEFTEKHEPGEGIYSYWRVTEDGQLEVYEYGVLSG